MKAERSLLGIMALFAMHTLVLSAAVDPSGEVRAALKHEWGQSLEINISAVLCSVQQGLAENIKSEKWEVEIKKS